MPGREDAKKEGRKQGMGGYRKNYCKGNKKQSLKPPETKEARKGKERKGRGKAKGERNKIPLWKGGSSGRGGKKKKPGTQEEKRTRGHKTSVTWNKMK